MFLHPINYFQIRNILYLQQNWFGILTQSHIRTYFSLCDLTFMGSLFYVLCCLFDSVMARFASSSQGPLVAPVCPAGHVCLEYFKNMKSQLHTFIGIGLVLHINDILCFAEILSTFSVKYLLLVMNIFIMSV